MSVAHHRQVHLAKIFDDAQGAMATHTQSFIAYVRNHEDLNQSIATFISHPIEINNPPQKNLVIRELVNSKLLSQRRSKDIQVELGRSEVLRHFVDNGDMLKVNRVTRSIIRNLLDEYFVRESTQDFDELHRFCVRPQVTGTIEGISKKLMTRQFYESVAPLYRQGNYFVRDPKIILDEAITTMLQVSSWLCMNSTTPQEIIDQMQTAVFSNILTPYARSPISPIELLGLGNNGYIGSVINGDFPTHINGEPIIRQAKEDDQNIIHPKFVALWLDRDLDIGGCPARTLQRRYNDIYTDFACLYIEVMEKVVEYDAQLRLKNANKPNKATSPMVA